jgi:hypothetical protein
MRATTLAGSPWCTSIEKRDISQPSGSLQALTVWVAGQLAARVVPKTAPCLVVLPKFFTPAKGPVILSPDAVCWDEGPRNFVCSQRAAAPGRTSRGAAAPFLRTMKRVLRPVKRGSGRQDHERAGIFTSLRTVMKNPSRNVKTPATRSGSHRAGGSSPLCPWRYGVTLWLKPTAWGVYSSPNNRAGEV